MVVVNECVVIVESYATILRGLTVWVWAGPVDGWLDGGATCTALEGGGLVEDEEEGVMG